MQTLTRPRITTASFKPPKRRRFSPLMFIGIGVTLLIVLGGGTFMFFQSRLFTHAADANPNCTLIVPANPLSAQGLATPFQLVATDPKQGDCHEASTGQAAFVQGAVIDPASGNISIYNPLVIDKGTKPAATSVIPQLPQNAVVALWFGFNGSNLTLKATNNSLRTGRCVTGANGSIFGQYSYCNAPAFFDAANQAIKAGKLTPPALGTAKDGLTCPTVRDFSIVDQDQSDNVTTAYLITDKGQTAQVTAANSATLPNAKVLTNGSDNRLLDIAVDGALGCKPWTAPDLADSGNMLPALPLNELQAAAHQSNPVAIVPAGDPMVLVNGKLNLNKLNAYRLGVNQLPANNLNQASTKTYCANMLAIGAPRIFRDKEFTQVKASPDMAAANNLFTFLAQRFNASFGTDNLKCDTLLKQKSPITVTTDNNGVATDATLDQTQSGGNGNGIPVNCTVNGTQVKGCIGTVTINGQQCTFTFDQNANQVNLNCPGGNSNQDNTAPPAQNANQQ